MNKEFLQEAITKVFFDPKYKILFKARKFNGTVFKDTCNCSFKLSETD